MSSEAIAVEALGKEYRLGSRMPAYRTLRESLSASMQRRGGKTPERSRTIWALRDVSFEIQKGEAIGVIGANGAGKTTLLKVLSRITQPTEGEARVHGRVGSLLEVGTGFHPELTGRENVYLNGAILGMPRKEIEGKFDEIVAFAGVEQFIDTPVKRYSSGMYVRLAFAVAAHLDSDILFVDEVLSVGDFGFQRRCLGKMQEQTSAEGRTVLFVSHNLASVKLLTQRCLWLDKGRLREFGPTSEVFANYVRSHGEMSGQGSVDLSDLSEKRAPKILAHELSFERLELRGVDGSVRDTFLSGEPITVSLTVRAHAPMNDRRADVRCWLSTLEGTVVTMTGSGIRPLELQPGLFETGFTLDPNPLEAGSYSLELYVATMSDYEAAVGQDLVPGAIAFRVEDNPSGGFDEAYAVQFKERGLIRVESAWQPFAETEDVPESRARQAGSAD